MSTDQTRKKPPETDAQMNLRDSILQELFQNADLNSAELSRLTIQDVDIEAGCLHVYRRNAMRPVPVRAATMEKLRQYIQEVRTQNGKPCKADDALFVSVFTAEPMTPTHVQKSMMHHIKQLRQIGELPSTLVSQLVTAESIRRDTKPE